MSAIEMNFASTNLYLILIDARKIRCDLGQQFFYSHDEEIHKLYQIPTYLIVWCSFYPKNLHFQRYMHYQLYDYLNVL